jgi:hypothetical protein
LKEEVSHVLPLRVVHPVVLLPFVNLLKLHVYVVPESSK